ncbi:hypothetical protein H257_06438 [Aphanomyces astaci]|uniref:Alpha/beta hydrolase fold-3 domain-containing protein n=1 Tax=Aphanomyces astaci TaxID=112090 RepID=W4GQ51_APHAT|nr:hypothetical protein H257_06438 [Aphanomyces astaci]ETV81003.1 hypothetical protein H257_06438 [Aphanomyces astaci]|eukprot:XP_009829950.1 hypothetical protein H257_06438 [Aphanomyces astaci]
MVMLGDVLVAIWYSLATPLVVLFHRPHAKWSYMEALSQRLMSHFTPLGIDVVRFGFAFFGRVQRLAYWPSAVVDTSAVKGLWYGDIKSPLQDSVVIFYVHGGGFGSGTADCMSTSLFQPLLQSLEQSSRRPVRLFSVEYDLAPQHPYPRAINQAFDAYMWLLGQGVPSSNVVLCGDSAGGNAVLTLMQRGRRDNAPLPACAILVSPWLDLTMTSPFYDVKTDIFTKRTIVAWRDVYLNNDVTKIHEASPGLQSLDGLPPLMVMYGQTELMAGDIATFVAKAKRCHVDVTEYLHPHLYHDFVIFPLGKPSRDAIHALAQFVVLKLDNHSNNTN